MSSHKESGGLDLKSKNVNWSLLCFFNAPIPCETQSQSQVSGGNFQADTQEYFKSLLLDQMHMAKLCVLECSKENLKCTEEKEEVAASAAQPVDEEPQPAWGMHYSATEADSLCCCKYYQYQLLLKEISKWLCAPYGQGCWSCISGS